MCKVKDSDSLADCMQKVLNLSAPDIQKMGVAGREKMQSQFDEHIVFNAYLSAIGAICNEGGSAIAQSLCALFGVRAILGFKCQCAPSIAV